MIIAQNYEGKH